MPKNKNVKSFEQKILLLQRQSKGRTVSIAQVLHALSGRGRDFVVIILSLPFCLPLQIPGLSTPFGLAIAFIGTRMAFAKHTWLPKKILSKKIPGRAFNKMTTKVLWLRKKVKCWTHPRLVSLSSSPSMKVMNGVLICILGIILALPLPIPFSNLATAWSLFLICLGKLENDGVLIIAGYAISLLTWVFFILVIVTLWPEFHKG